MSSLFYRYNRLWVNSNYRYWYFSHSAAISAMTENQGHRTLGKCKTRQELLNNWKKLKSKSNPILPEYTKMIQMCKQLNEPKLMSEMYHEFLDNLSSNKEWKDMNTALNATYIMRCAHFVHDWRLIHEWMHIYIQNEWPFNKLSANHSLECCQRYYSNINYDGIIHDNSVVKRNKGDMQMSNHEMLVCYIWDNLLKNDIPNHFCFIQLLHNLNRHFNHSFVIQSMIDRVLNDAKAYVLNQMKTNNNGTHFYFIIVQNSLEILLEKKAYTNKVNEIADEFMLNQKKNKLQNISLISLLSGDLSLYASNRDIQRYSKVPMKIIQQLMKFYSSTNDVQRMIALFDIQKRVLNIMLSNIEQSLPTTDDCKSFLMYYWKVYIQNEGTLPVFLQVFYEYFSKQTLFAKCEEEELEIRHAHETYIRKAYEISQYINCYLFIPLPSLFMVGILYAYGMYDQRPSTKNVMAESGHNLLFDVIEKYFNNQSKDEIHAYSKSRNFLLHQWRNKQWILNLSQTENIPHLLNMPLILCSMIFIDIQERNIEDRAKNSKMFDLKIRLDYHRLQEIVDFFEFLGKQFPPVIEYQVVGHIPKTLVVIHLDPRSFIKWSAQFQFEMNGNEKILCKLLEFMKKYYAKDGVCEDLLPMQTSNTLKNLMKSVSKLQ